MHKTKAELQNELQEKTLTIIGAQYNVGVAIGTGGGKTLLGLKHMAKRFHDSIAFLVLMPKTSVKQEWLDNMKEHGYEYLLPHITFANYRSISKQDLGYDWAYLDECHSLKYTHGDWMDAYLMSGGKVIGLTGTYPKRGEKFDMCDRYCPKIFEYNIDQAIDEGMLNNYKIFVHMLPLDNKHTVKKKKANGGFWPTSEVKDNAYWTNAIASCDNPGKLKMLRIYRMKAFQSYPSKIEYVKKILKKIDYKTIIFTTTQDQADEVCEYSYHSGNKKSEENLQLFKEGKIYRMSCVEQLSEGKTIKGLKVGIITHAYANDTKTRQKIGRFLRLSPEETAIIHILCYDNTIDLQWVKSALSTFRQHQITIYRP